MITIVGTAHCLNLDKQLKSFFEEVRPDSICLELDQERFNIIEEILTKHPTFSNRKDMQYSICYARANNIPIKLIDKPGSGKIKNHVRALPFLTRCKINLIRFFSLSILFLMPYVIFFYRSIKIASNLNSYILSNNKIKQSLKKNDLKLYRSLMTDREKYMVNSLIYLSECYNNLIAIVGDAHLPGINRLLNDASVEHEIIPLKKYFNEPVYVKSIVDYRIDLIIVDFLFRFLLFANLVFLIKNIFL
jgi:pheromone shutdown protein TraB